MIARSLPSQVHLRAVTMIEVLVAALLIMLSLGSIFMMNARSLSILRSTRQISASSMMLQQRVETIRGRMWPEISNATGLSGVMNTPTESEKELTDAVVTEVVEVSVPPRPGATASESPVSFVIRRKAGEVKVLSSGDLGSESMLLFKITLTWVNQHGPKSRELQTIVCRTGLTRGGIFGSGLGQPPAPATTTSSTGSSPLSVAQGSP